MPKVFLSTLTICVLLTACQPPLLAPRTTRWYDLATFDPQGPEAVEMTVFSIPTPTSQPADGIFRLSPEAQTAFITSLNGKTKDPETLAQSIALPFHRRPAGVPGQRDATLVNQRVVFSIENRSIRPADRLHQARLVLRLQQTPARRSVFRNWSRLVTRFDTVDLGTLSASQGASVGGEIGLTLPVASGTAKLNSSAESGLNEAVSFSRRFVELNGALEPERAVLLQQGTVGLDLTGNVSVDFEIDVATEHTFIWLYSISYDPGNGVKFCERETPRVRRQYTDYVPDTSSVRGIATLEYVMRRVVGGDQTITESDDRVTFSLDTLRLPDPVVIVPGEQLLLPVWRIRSDSPDRFLMIRSIGGAEGSTNFTIPEFLSYEDADRMVRWLRECGAKLPNYEVALSSSALARSGRELTPADAALLRIDRIIINETPADASDRRNRLIEAGIRRDTTRTY